MAEIDLVTGPAAEPVSVSDMLLQLGMETVSDPTLSAQLNTQLGGYIAAARQACEEWCRRVFITQTWLFRLNGFPGIDWRYNWNGYPAIRIPYAPLQSIYSVQYVDASGAVQSLPRDTSYGSSSSAYGYQLLRGSDTQCGVLISAWARPWPPTRMVASNVMIKFRAGYGGPASASMQAGSGVLAGPLFNPDDAPVMAGETGTAVTVPGAGPSGADLVTTVASVDANGHATLAAKASAEVADAQAWIGQSVPPAIVQAIKFLAQFYYEQGSVVDQPLPRVVTALLAPYFNGES